MRALVLIAIKTSRFLCRQPPAAKRKPRGNPAGKSHKRGVHLYMPPGVGYNEVSMTVAKKKNEDWVNSPRDALRGDGRSLDDDLEIQQLKVC